MVAGITGELCAGERFLQVEGSSPLHIGQAMELAACPPQYRTQGERKEGKDCENFVWLGFHTI